MIKTEKEKYYETVFEKGNSFFLPANSGTYALCGSYEALITTV